MARKYGRLLEELDAIPHPITGGYDPIKRRNVDKTSAAGKVVRARSTLSKSAPATSLQDFFAKAQAAGGKVTITEKKPSKKVAMKGGKLVEPAKTGAATPPEHVALRVARAIGEMKQHAQGRDLNGPVSEKQLLACHALCRAGEMSESEVADVEAAMKDARALPTYLLKKLGNGNS